MTHGLLQGLGIGLFAALPVLIPIALIGGWKFAEWQDKRQGRRSNDQRGPR
jgi:hypothetical protein